LYIPREALQGNISNAKVYLAKDGKAILHPVTIGNSTDEYLEVISGLNEGDEIITSGFVSLEDGKAIKINASSN
jgi:multidrug efflux pump subunit AcrA (membrane-fusion protein)